MHVRHVLDRIRRATRGPVPPCGVSRRRSTAVTAAVALVAVAGCADPEGGAGATPDDSADPTDGAVVQEAPLLQIHHAGGFLPFGLDFATVPELTVYGDGQAIVHGPQIAVFPPPALPNLLTADLAEADVDALVAAAREAGLLDEPPDYGHPPVADAGTTFVTLRVDGITYEHAAEALGLAPGEEGANDGEPGTEDPPPPEALPGDEELFGLSPEQRAARAALADFIPRAHELVGTDEAEPYDITMFAVTALAVPADAAAQATEEEPADGGVEATEEPAEAATENPSGSAPVEEPTQPVLDWPVDVALADARECVLVTGEDARTLRDVLTGTGRTAQFTQDGVRYDVGIRPLLPHERSCDDL